MYRLLKTVSFAQLQLEILTFSWTADMEGPLVPHLGLTDLYACTSILILRIIKKKACFEKNPDVEEQSFANFQLFNSSKG